MMFRGIQELLTVGLIVVPALICSSVRAEIVINELMYHSQHVDGDPEDVSLEFLELHNTDAANAIDVSGWSISQGVTYVFEAGTSIAAGDFLVVAADTGRRPELVNQVGPWIGRLSNRGERVTLVDAEGVVIDTVEYFDEGEWAVKVRDDEGPGWHWQSSADGGGGSLELIAAGVPNEFGANWADSSTVGGTPGQSNSTAEDHIAPIITGVNHFPGVPSSSDEIRVIAQIVATSSELVTVQANFGGDSMEMLDDGQHGDGAAGDGIYGVIFPRQSTSIYSLSVEAISSDRQRTWPKVIEGVESPLALVEVSDRQSDSDLAVYRIVMTSSDSSTHRNLDRESNALLNCTFIAGDSVHYFAGLRFRGNSSRRASAPGQRVALPRDDPFSNTDKLNLNPGAAYLQILGMTLFKQSGLPAPEAKPVEVLFNSDRFSSFSNYRVYANIEPLGDQFIQNHFPKQERGGNMYKKQGGHRGNWAYRGDEPAEYQTWGWEKRNNSSAADWQDLFDFHQAVNTDPASPSYLEVMKQNGDLDKWMRWYAMNNLLANRETNLSNGADDDYSMYRRPTDNRWIFLPHDLDTILGEGQGRRSIPEEDVFQMLDRNFADNSMERVRPLFEHPEIAALYRYHLRDLLKTVFAPENFNPTVDHVLPFIEVEVRERLKDFVEARHDHVLRLLDGNLSVGIDLDLLRPLLQGRVSLDGAAAVLVNGVPAEFNRMGTWSIQLENGNWSLVDESSRWKYFGVGGEPGLGWSYGSFDDSAWRSGTAPFGYGGDSAYRTWLSSGGVDGVGNQVTRYFRKKFQVEQVDLLASATIGLRRDDGAVVYVNGVEVVRDNLPALSEAMTTANSEVEGIDETTYFSYPIDPSLLVVGENVVAVEVHISDPDLSPDLRFDLSLSATIDAPVNPDLYVYPGINRYTITVLDAEGRVIEEAYQDVTDATSDLIPLNGTLQSDMILERGDGAYEVTGNLVIPVGVTLTIMPGTTVFFAPDAKITVNGTLIAAGDPDARIRFGVHPDRPLVADIHPLLPLALPKWDGIKLIDSNNDENRIAYVDFLHAQDSTGALGITRSKVDIIGCSFASTHLRMIYVDSSSVLIEDCRFADVFDADQNPAQLELDNGSEHIKGIGGIPADGQFIIRGCEFGSNRGHNGVIDVKSGQRPAPILQVLDNIFSGAEDHMIELGGDAYIAGNVFENVVDPNVGYASAISSGDGSPGATIVVVGNVFSKVDHAINLKRSDATIFEHNTVLGLNRGEEGDDPSVVNLYVDEPFATAGGGAHVAHNLFAGTPRIFGNADLPAGTNSRLGFRHNRYNPAVDTALVGERGISAGELGVANFVGWATIANLEADAYSLAPESPATGAGELGQNLGASAAAVIHISGEPGGVTRETGAMIDFGGPGMFAFRYRINDGAWSEIEEIGNPNGFNFSGATVRTATVELAGLAPGAYTIEAIGRDFAGNWQEENAPTLSETWTVDPSAPATGGVILSEVHGSTPGGNWVELHNSSTAQIDVSGHMLTASSVGGTFIFPLGTSIPAGHFISADFEGDWTEGNSVTYTSTETGSETITFGIQIPGYSLGRDAGGNWCLTHPTRDEPNAIAPMGVPLHLSISEWLNDPGLVIDFDFIELYNPSPLPVALAGLSLTDSPYTQKRHEILPCTFIAARGYLAFEAGGDEDGTARQLGFKLSTDCESIALYDAAGDLLDFVHSLPAPPDFSAGINPRDPHTPKFFHLPTPGTLNEIEEQAVEGEESEFFPSGSTWSYWQNGNELPGWEDAGFDDSGWASGRAQLGFGNNSEVTSLIRGVATYYFRTTVSAPDAISSRVGYRAEVLRDDGLVVYVNGEEAFRQNMPDGLVDENSLASAGVAGSDERAFFSSQIPSGLFVEGGSNQIAVEVHQNSPGSSDMGFDLRLFRREREVFPRDPLFVRAEKIFDHLRITELMYHPRGEAGSEFIEFQNTSLRETLQLGGLRLADAVEFVFPEMDLPPGGHILVVEDIGEFEASYGAGLSIVGSYEGKLANGDDRVRLVLPAPMPARVLNFKYDDSWYPETDGQGSSLHIVDSLGERAQWTVPSGWTPAAPSPGTSLPADSFAEWARRYGIVDPEGDSNGDGVPHLIEYAFDLSPLAESSFSPVLPAVDSETGRFGFRLPAVSALDVRLSIESSSDLTVWDEIGSLDAGGGWFGSVSITLSTTPAGRTLVHVGEPVGSSGSLLYYRLRVEKIATP